MSERELAERLLGHPADEAQAAALDRAVSEVVAAARQAWPMLHLPADAFVSHLFERLGEVRSIRDALSGLKELRAGDLYLAFGCARGDEPSLRAFDQLLLAEIPVALDRIKPPNLGLEDAAQMLREKLFVGSDHHGPRVVEYRGRGELRNWLRVVVTRELLNAADRIHLEVPTARALLLTLPSLAGNPELLLTKAKYRQEFRAAFEQAVRALSARERNLLRYSMVEGRSVDFIAAVYHVHRATAARWVSGAKDALVAATRRLLKRTWRVDEQDLPAIVRLIQSQLHLSLKRLFRTLPAR